MVKLHVVVIYRPPGQLGTFLKELDGLLSSFPEDGSPLVVFGDFNIHLDKPYAANFHSLLASFDLKCLTTTSTHKSGSQLDLIYTCNCVADNVLVKPLHTSDHYFITFNLHLATSEPPTPLPVTFRWNLRSLSPFTSNLGSVLLSSLTYPFLRSGCEHCNWHFVLHFNFLSRPYVLSPPGQHVLHLLTPGYPMLFMNIGPNSRQQRENGTNQKIHQTWISISLCFHLSLLKSTLPRLHTSTTRSTAHLTHAISWKHSTLSSVQFNQLS